MSVARRFIGTIDEYLFSDSKKAAREAAFLIL